MCCIAGVTILYNPDKKILSNILSYLNQIELLYIVDNSDKDNSYIIDSLKMLKKIRLIDNDNNIGIAKALNKAATAAINDGYDFLLTMDQDSRVSGNLVQEFLFEFEKDNKIGLLSPFVVHEENPAKPTNKGLKEITVAMTSGSIIRLSAYKQVGGYLDKLFIDYVDHEYCLRLKSFGYKILQLNSAHIYHNLGAVKCKNFMFKKFFPTNHSPLRLYYRTRNRFYVHKIYRNIFPDYIKQDRKMFLKENLKILLFENNKIKKIRMIIYGYLDYLRNKFERLI